MTAELMQARQTVLPKRLVVPGPDAAQRHSILAAAASAPDHGQLLPWRFITVPPAQRAALAEVFAQALLERDASASAEQVAQARDKAHRAPWLMLVVVDGLRGDPDVDLHERILSAGCAVQNVLLMTTAQGWGLSKKYPCNMSHPCWARKSAWARVSTPSATVWILKRRAMDRMACTNAASSPSA